MQRTQTGPRFVVRDSLAGHESQILTAVLTSVDLGVMLTDLEHQTLALNHQFGVLFGVGPEAIVNLDVESVRNSVRGRIADYEQWTAKLERVYSDPMGTFEDVLILKDPPASLARSTFPVQDEDGQPVGRVWTFQDVTHKARVEAISQILHQMSSLYSPDPKKVYDHLVRSISQFYHSTCVLSLQEGEIMRFHSIASPVPGVEQMTQNTLSQSFCQFCLEADAPLIIQDARKNPRHAQTLPVTLGVCRYMGVPIHNSQGDTIGTLCILDDRMDELLTEEDLNFMQLVAMRLTAEIEREAQVDALQSDLAEARIQLIQNEKLAVTGALAATIAHDIKNIVSAIQLDWMHESDDSRRPSPKAFEHLDRFNILAHRLLAYAQPRDVSLRSVSILPTLHRVLDLFARHFEVANVQLVLNLPKDVASVQADEDRIDSLFANIVMNALQAMPQGGTLTITVEETPHHVMVKVDDSGHGISESQLKKVFLPFSSGRSDGFGLGLYSCAQIMSDANGTISVKNLPEGGVRVGLEFHKE